MNELFDATPLPADSPADDDLAHLRRHYPEAYVGHLSREWSSHVRYDGVFALLRAWAVATKRDVNLAYTLWRDVEIPHWDELEALARRQELHFPTEWGVLECRALASAMERYGLRKYAAYVKEASAL